MGAVSRGRAHTQGGVDKRTIEKYEKEAKEKNREGWYMAYIMDTNEEERAKGITVEVRLPADALLRPPSCFGTRHAEAAVW